MTEGNSGSHKENNFADTIEQRYNILNNNENFKNNFKDEDFKILLNPKDGDSAALITVDKGVLTVDAVDNSSKKNLKQEILNWNGYMETTIDLFRAIGRGELTRGDITKKVVSRKIKVKNIEILAKFGELSALLRK
ncbi:MAG: hypothetical protein ACFFEN_01050 [Candidatus Thorarchaeota archaeon]